MQVLCDQPAQEDVESLHGDIFDCDSLHTRMREKIGETGSTEVEERERNGKRPVLVVEEDLSLDDVLAVILSVSRSRYYQQTMAYDSLMSAVE